MDELLQWRGEFPILEHSTSPVSDSRGAMPRAGTRLSPHFYNCEGECDFALEQMVEILATRAWERHAAAASHA